MVDPKKPNRNVLARYFKDHETLRAFEQLFDVVQPLSTTNVEAIQIEAGSANTRAQSALDSLENIEHLLGIVVSSPDKGQQALDTISQLADAVDFLSKAPKQMDISQNLIDLIDLLSKAPRPIELESNDLDMIDYLSQAPRYEP